MAGFELQLPGIRGSQGGRPYYVVMCPLRHLPRLLRLGENGDQPELHAHRVLNKGRVPEIARYITENSDSYVLSSIVVSLDQDVSFEPAQGKVGSAGIGMLKLPIATRMLIHDGIHRGAAIESALRVKPELGDQTISLVLYVDPGFRRSEQIFSDLKRHESRSSRSQALLSDGRDQMALITKEVIKRVEVFDGMTEMARSKISNRSLKLFTFSGIYHATKILLSEKQGVPFAEQLALATAFWTEVASNIPDWGRAKRREVSPAELRATCVHSHAIALSALAKAGRALLDFDQKKWHRRLMRLRKLDWSRSNARLWDGRAMIAGRLSKTSMSIVLTGSIIKKLLELPLTSDEEQIEERLKEVNSN